MKEDALPTLHLKDEDISHDDNVICQPVYVHEEEKPFKCQINKCGFTFKLKKSLKAPIKIVIE